MGKMGRLQTLSMIPVLPGDSFDIDMEGIIRLTPMRREIVQECQVDICAFFVPHRHVYGAQWLQMVREGYDTTVTLPTVAIAAAGQNSYYLGTAGLPVNAPTWLIEGYQRIWDQYYRVPHQPSDANFQQVPVAATTADDNYRKFGRLCARLPHCLNTATRLTGAGAASWRDLTAGDADVAAVATLDIRDLSRVQGEYESEVDRVWFTDRYRDILDKQWGTFVNTDADQRPEMLWHDTFNVSGKDVDGTADANLGNFVGKTIAPVRVRIPRKKFNEHGAIWILALCRFPLINWRETHPLVYTTNNYANLVADPAIWSNSQPEGANFTRWLAPAGGATSTEFFEAFGNHYRLHNNRVHPDFDYLAGYPWQSTFDATGLAYYYHQDTDYDLVFQSSQLAHWQMQLRINCEAQRHVPNPLNSVYAGTQ